MKKSWCSLDFSVGFVLFVAMVIVIGGLFLVGDGKSWFADHVEYKVLLPSAQGLRAGSRVRLQGVDVGSVTRISFPDDLTISEVEAVLSVQKDYTERIREDSYAWLQTEGLLGDISVHIKLGTAGKEALAAGAQIPYKERSLLEDLAGEKIGQSTADLLQSLMAILGDIQKGEGTLGKFLKDPELYDNLNTFTRSVEGLSKQLQGLTKEFEDVLAEVRTQKGTLGKLVFSESYAKDFTKALADASALIGNLRAVSEDIKAGKGSLGRAIVEPTLHDTGVKTLADLSRVADRMEKLLGGADGSGSILDRIASDPSTGGKFADLISRLEGAAGSLERILNAVDKGEGTAGMLVHDPSVAAGLRDILLGVNESGIIKNRLRNAEQDGRARYLQEVNLTAAEEKEMRRARALAEVARISSGSSVATPVPAPAPASSDSGKLAPAVGPDVEAKGPPESGEKKPETERKD
jgi:phospholipid/cholesterol/gamma-HCH transport system substrate-binding protein